MSCFAFQFHLAEAEGETETYKASVVAVAAGGLVLRSGGVATPFRPAENVADIQIYAHLAVEEVAATTKVEALVCVGKTVESQSRRTVTAVGEDLVPFP